MTYRYPTVKLCRNPRCMDNLHGKYLLCPSCRYFGKRAFAVGAFVAGAIAWLLR